MIWLIRWVGFIYIIISISSRCVFKETVGVLLKLSPFLAWGTCLFISEQYQILRSDGKQLSGSEEVKLPHLGFFKPRKAGFGFAFVRSLFFCSIQDSTLEVSRVNVGVSPNTLAPCLPLAKERPRKTGSSSLACGAVRVLVLNVRVIKPRGHSTTCDHPL